MRSPSVAFVLALSLAGCRAKNEGDPLVERAAFGVFFGSQIQDRSELPFELDQTKQQCGIRIDFRAPLVRSASVEWEIVRPERVKAARADAGADRVVEVGDTTARVGERRLDVPITLRQGQVLGTWHVRVKVDSRMVIDRDVSVFDQRERDRRDRDAGH